MSFRLKTILGVAAIEIILLSILIVSALSYLRTSNQKQLDDRAHTTARLLAAMTSDSVVALDLATLDSLLTNSGHTKGIEYIRVRAANGTVLAQHGQTVGQSATFMVDESVDRDDGDHRFDLIEPITVAGTVFGHIELSISTLEMEQTFREATRWMLTVVVLDIGLVAFFGFILGGILTRQLSDLQTGARLVAEGNFGHLIEVHGDDELADTARSFNRMSSSLAKYASDLEDARLKAEAGRDLAESVLQDAVESLTQGVLILDDQGRRLKCNRAFGRLYPDVAVRLSQADTIHQIAETTAPYIAEVDDQNSHAADKGARDYLDGPERWTSRLTDGRRILHTRRPLSTGGWVIVETDVTAIFDAQERARKLERELMQAQKMEALGTLAGGIAHEINTPIQYIGDNLRFLEGAADDLIKVVDVHRDLAAAARSQDLLTDRVARCQAAYEDGDVDFLREEALQAARQSIEGVRQVANIVLAMKEFSHPASKEMSPVDLNRVLERSAVVCKSEWKQVAEVAFELDPDLPSIVGLEGALNQVALNLIVNAAHAIAAKEDGMGRITVRTCRLDDGVRLEVADTGTGVPNEIIDRIFEPFFTTKDVGGGTGQGLALVHDIIVNKHGGRIDVVSHEDQGTTFVILLPFDAQGRKAA